MFQSRLPKRLLRVFIAGLCLFFISQFNPVSSAYGQSSGDATPALLNQAGTNPLLLLRQRLSQGSLASAGIPMEGAVDPDAYVVGPGDSFAIFVAGQDITGAPVAVGIDGRIVLPDAGAIQVGGNTLTSAREKMLSALHVSYANADVEVALVQSRQFYVHVSGAVPRPGRYLALPVARVSSVLEFAFADTTAMSVSNPAFRPSLRNISVLHKDGSSSSVDIIRYYSTGDHEANPYLEDGDVISVPAGDPNFGTISVGGYVPFPGSYDYKDGDTLWGLIQIAGGLADNPNIREVRVSRTEGASIKTHAFSRSESLGKKGRSFLLKPLDVVSVSQLEERHGLVSVEGRVEFPGSYPVVAGKTSLTDVMNAAGGTKTDALLRGAFIERSTKSDPTLQGVVDRYQGQTDVLKRMLRSDTTAIMQQLRLIDLDFLSRAYFTLELRLQNRVSVNVEESLRDDSDPVYLQPGDRIVIPQDANSVYVVGQVNQPGFVPIQAGMSAEYYIGAAGGRSQSANLVYVVNPATGSYVESASGTVQSGDVVFVDRGEAFADSADLQRLVIEDKRLEIEKDRIRADARFRTVQTVLQSVATLASAVALIISLRK